jgi:hypothetical protein
MLSLCAPDRTDVQRDPAVLTASPMCLVLPRSGHGADGAPDEAFLRSQGTYVGAEAGQMRVRCANYEASLRARTRRC